MGSAWVLRESLDRDARAAFPVDESTTTGLFDLFLLREHCSADPRLRFSHSHQRPNDAGIQEPVLHSTSTSSASNRAHRGGYS